MTIVALVVVVASVAGWKVYRLSCRVDVSLHGVPRLMSDHEYAARRRRLRGEPAPLPGARLR